MKNKFKIFFIFLISFFLSSEVDVLSNEIKFEAEYIETINENTITATNNIIISDSKGNKIYGNKLIIKEKKIYTISGKVIFENSDDSIKLEAREIEYNVSNNIIRSFGPTKITKDNNYILNTSNIFYNIQSKNIYSSEETQVEDLQSNKIKIENFDISLTENLLKADKAFIVDKDLNQYELEKIFYDFGKNKILGKDIILNKDNNLSNERYLPRAKGRSFILENDNMTFTKGIYTNCKKTDGCSPWSIKAQEINHDKKNKIVKYKNASVLRHSSFLFS